MSGVAWYNLHDACGKQLYKISANIGYRCLSFRGVESSKYNYMPELLKTQFKSIQVPNWPIEPSHRVNRLLDTKYSTVMWDSLRVKQMTNFTCIVVSWEKRPFPSQTDKTKLIKCYHSAINSYIIMDCKICQILRKSQNRKWPDKISTSMCTLDLRKIQLEIISRKFNRKQG